MHQLSIFQIKIFNLVAADQTRKIYTQMKELRLINESLAQRNSDVTHTTLHIETPSIVHLVGI